jgi:predicted metal-dependent RNase
MLYTADIKFAKTHILSPAATSFPRLETLIVEATYGGKDNIGATAKQADDLMSDLVKRTVDRKGKILMPVLGSGRAQEVLVFIQKLISEGKIPEIPIYIDGMVWDITAIHTAYPEFLNKYVRQMIFSKEGNPFLRANVKRVGSHQERMKVIEEEGSCIILATSGMLVGGPSVEYLKRISRDKRHSLIFSSYLGPGTLGKRIFSGEREIWLKISGNESDLLVVNMEISKVNVSSHADRRELMNFVGRCNPKPRKVIVNHGEVSKILDLASSIHRQFRVETLAPRNLEAIRLR